MKNENLPSKTLNGGKDKHSARPKQIKDTSFVVINVGLLQRFQFQSVWEFFAVNSRSLLQDFDDFSMSSLQTEPSHRFRNETEMKKRII